jgi:hypothetical protein
MSKGDGKNMKFRVLCKRCNSYLHTVVYAGNTVPIRIVCTKCNNAADSFEEEADAS